VPGSGIAPDLAVNGPLGAQFLAWEYATAIAGHLIGINPFDQPNVAESKANTSRILTEGAPGSRPAFQAGPVEVYADAATLGGATTLVAALQSLVAGTEERGYLAIMAYLDRFADEELARIRELIAGRTSRPVTFGWGPRFLHSTGQYHKGGPSDGSFLQITGASTTDVPVPGRPYSFGDLIAAQAAGDRQAIVSRGRPLLRLHLTDRVAGISAILSAASEIIE
jgi:hypothetical protein